MILRLIAHPFASFILLILAVDFMVLSRITQFTSVKEEQRHLGRRRSLMLNTVLLFYVVLVYTEILLLGHTLYTPILLALSVAFCTFVAEAYNVRKGLISIYLPFLLAVIITAHYIVFPPSFGNDTWRDIMWSEETLRTGYFTKSRITHPAYSVPLVVLLYSVTGLIEDFTVIDSSSIIGLLYLFILDVILIAALRRIHKEAERSIIAILLLLTYSIPLITLWSVWFIPQSLALIYMALLLITISLKHYSLMIQIPLAIALVFSHPGVALYALIYITYLFIFMGKAEKFRKLLLLISTVYIAYTIYTSVQYMIVPGVKSYFDYLLTVFLGIEVNQVQAPLELGVFNRLFPWIPVATVFILGINTIYANSLKQEKRDEREVLVVIFSAITLTVGYVLTIINPQSTADRYIGLPATFLLILFSYSGVKILKVKQLSKGLLYGLVALLILVMAFGGTFTPLNPMTFNPSRYSIYGLPTYGDGEIVRSVVKNTDPYNQLTIYTDWRTGIIYEHDLLQEYNAEIHSSSCPIKIGNLNLQLFGSCGYRYRGDLSFMRSNSILILRATSFTMVESWDRFKPKFTFQYYNISKILDSDNGNVIMYYG